MFSHPESCELGCFVLGNGNVCLCAGSTNMSGTREWFALNSAPSRGLLPVTDCIIWILQPLCFLPHFEM